MKYKRTVIIEVRVDIQTERKAGLDRVARAAFATPAPETPEKRGVVVYTNDATGRLSKQIHDLNERIDKLIEEFREHCHNNYSPELPTSGPKFKE